MPEVEIKRLNIRVSEPTHYWLNLDAARHSRSLQQHVDALLTERAEEVSRTFGGKRPDKQ
jgi:predicted HicB family RNase H-like nuclease